MNCPSTTVVGHDKSGPFLMLDDFRIPMPSDEIALAVGHRIETWDRLAAAIRLFDLLQKTPIDRGGSTGTHGKVLKQLLDAMAAALPLTKGGGA